MTKTIWLASFALAAAGLLPAMAEAKDYQVRMLNKGANGGMMVFEPAFLAVKPGDSVTFVATDPGHNVESLDGMIPAGAAPFKGGFNQPVTVKLTKPGLYGYKCLPHGAMGMVGLIEVGSAANKPQLAAATTSLPGLAKRKMGDLLAQAH
jgi:pseudoazurin